MISASAGMIAHIAQRTTTLAMLWLVTRTDGEVFGFAAHDVDITYDGVTYIASQGFSPSALASGSGLAVGNAEVGAVFNASYVTEGDLRAGVWDHADVRIRLINWADTTQGVLKMLRGWLGEVKFDGFTFTVELRGLMDLLNRSTGDVVTPGCNAVLGDARCGVELSDYTTSGEVTAVTDNRVFDTDLSGATVQITPSTTGAPPLDYFQAGLLTWVTGANAGRSMEVRTSAVDGQIDLQLPMESDVVAGDTFTVVTGCMKSKSVCKTKFGNVVNFRGFPEVPGVDQVLRIGGQ